MSDGLFDIDQPIFKASYPTIRVVPCSEDALTDAILDDFLSSATTDYIGVAPVYGPNCKLVRIAFSTMSDVLLVFLASSKASRKNRQHARVSGRELLINGIFRNSEFLKCAFKMDKLAAALFLDLRSRVTGGVDLLSISHSNRHAMETFLTVLGGEMTLHREEAVSLFELLESTEASISSLALQAWVAYRAGTLPSTYERLKHLPTIETMDLPTTVCVVYCPQ